VCTTDHCPRARALHGIGFFNLEPTLPTSKPICDKNFDGERAIPLTKHMAAGILIEGKTGFVIRENDKTGLAFG
jgi:hypothetical protein